MDPNNPNQDAKTSSSNYIGRTAQMLQAASPYLDDEAKQSFGFLLRISDMMETFQQIIHPGKDSLLSRLFRNRSSNQTVRMSNLNFDSTPKIDYQGLFHSIRPFCTPRESSLIDSLLQIMQMKQMMETYQMMQSMMSMMNPPDTESSNAQAESQEAQNSTDDYNKSHPNNSHNSNTSNEKMMEMLATMIPPEQKSTFETMKMMMDAGLFNT